MLKDITNAIGAKLQKASVGRKLTRKLVSNIGSSTVLGQKNTDTYYSRIGKMVKEDKQEEAMEYSKSEGDKVMRDNGQARRIKK